MADIYQALSSPVRREILAMLKKEDLTAGDISEQIDIAKSTLSGHFNVLKEAGLVVTVKSGTTITYSLNTSVVEELMSGLINLFGSNSKNEKDNV
ncbi:autorepressor SdpR family transcription factor [Psychrosphaera haliotis]|nr:autorepressor SdpR family transcription factor [Psychrosphaera haliotis]